ncbi:Dinucleotide-utilizing enzymes involved in molybdopterin and thiamine biosynthesis family 2 [Luteococcus japonicus LSP_Lj1]|uniref:Dinucleotide-utilizing enzymes involved in molybdopterin and thiamine biosynthesis family 2 n=2 Tax=Luteococcus japonicus TaxID=33984 RepID=A0A1R4IJA8_9ACTN|nr:Dinucleotide-utilizing enzymes involved in molybdopterin and thiamine biosynthesis family 2 [Luteococcus japonicus LSP_Lj1]
MSTNCRLPPRYFVGRGEPVRDLLAHMEARRGPFVLNAQSGWGKSSLALMLASKISGLSFVLDTRTASSPSYVAAAVRHAALAAERAGLLVLPDDASWATTAGALRSLRDSSWRDGASLLVVFDQFENAFSDAALTAEFRDAALWSRENPEHVTLAFAWKTDYVDWIESHPYRLRDQIREASKVVNLAPFGSREVETVLRRLEAAVGAGLSRELRQRLREYSQGLPWLLKKLSGHLITEMASGKSQEQLIGEALNVQNLFDSDLAALSPQERDALNFVARYAPVRAAEVTERFTAGLVQSLLNQRLIVQVGEKLDTYWDIFRDYLNSGRVPIEDSYILRLSPNSVARLVSELLAHSGSAATSEIAEAWETTENVVWNLARELRQLGLGSSAGGFTSLAPEIVGSSDPEHEIRSRVANALRRHRAYSEFADLSERGQGRVQVSAFAARLREAFPAVQGTPNTWTAYARTFIAWFEYAGLVVTDRSGFVIAPEGSPGKGTLTARPASIVRSGAFPSRAPGPALELLRRSDGYLVVAPPEKRQYFRELVALAAVTDVSDYPTTGTIAAGLVVDGEIVEEVLLELLRAVPGGAEAVRGVEANSSVRSVEIGRIFEAAYATTWTDSTRDLVGKSFLAWARAAGLSTRRRSRRKMAIGTTG